MSKFAVFDIDGTLIRWQLYHAVVDKLAKAGALGPDAHEKIHQARMKWKRREDPDGFYLYEQRLIELFDKAVADLDPKRFDAMTQTVITEYQDQVYTYTRDLLNNLKKQGYLLFAVSGSQKELVAQLAEHYGFDDYIGTEYHRESNRFSGKAVVASHDKEAALKSLMSKHHVTIKGSWAVGDSKSDVPMLAMVDNPIAFNPDKSLYSEATKQGWKIVIERKNMIYELERNNGQYHLVEAN